MTRRLGSIFLTCAALIAGQIVAAELPAPLRGVQRILFLGDSITQRGDYVTDVDCWLVSSGIKIEVLNLGLASETAADLSEAENAGHKKSAGFGRPFVSERLDRVLAATRPDLVIACYGMNDGSNLSADESGTERFATAITKLRAAALKSGAKRVVICTPPPHDAKGNSAMAWHDENLTRYSAWLLSKRIEGWDVVDIHGSMRRVLDAKRAKDQGYSLSDDGVHPGREGHWLMATAILSQFVGAEMSGIGSAEELFKSDGKEIRELVHARMAKRFSAWMANTRHTRPGVPGGPGNKPGVSIEELNAQVADITKQINLKLGVSQQSQTTLSGATKSDGEIVLLSSLNLGEVLQSSGGPQANKSVEGKSLTISGQKYETGLGTHARSVLWIDLQGGSQRFTAAVGIDDEVVPRIVLRELRASHDKGRDDYVRVNGRVIFHIYGDGKLLWKSKLMRPGMPAEPVDVNLTGMQTMVMVASSMGDPIDSDHADWVDAKFVVTGAKPKTIPPPREPAFILTPKSSPKPKINGAKVFGVRPESPFLFTVPATGDRPMKFSAKNLPSGLKLDADSGQITGVLKRKGDWNVTLKARNSLGETARNFKIVCGDTLALTPQMGWNSWNVFSCGVNEAKVRAAADSMVSSGLINHGWAYVNIDDCWQSKHSSKDPLVAGDGRDANGIIQSNNKFPDMKALCYYIHSKGLKAGIYSSPGVYTCQGHTGSYQHEEQDAQRYAEWGFDYLKYDWCYMTYSTRDISLHSQRIPWVTMAQALRKTKRDIIFSLSETLEVWPWAKEVGANGWRNTGDITDTWSSMDDIGFTQNGREIVAGPGHWNDCDMFVVGRLGGGARDSRLTPNEQYTHISLWSLLASPMLIGCDMTQLDEFTLSLLTNDEVIEVNQDPLGKQAHRISKDENVEVWAKEMEDGSRVVGLFNRGEFENSVTVNWSDLGLSDKQIVRELWRQKDVGDFADSFSVKVPRHGVMLIRVRPAGK